MEWIKIDNINNLKLKENTPYLICIENWGSHGSEWHVMIAWWYLKGSEVTLREDDNTPHRHFIKNTGFYAINDCGRERFDYIYRIFSVNYYAEIEYPELSPDDVLSIDSQ